MASLSEIEKLEARFRENPEGRYFAPLADAYRKAGRVDDALMLVQAGLEKHPDYLSAHIVLGRCHLDKKDDTAAMAAFQSVLGLDAENIIALKSLAEISERMGNPLDARRWLMRLLAVDAMNSEAEEYLHRLGGPVEEEAPAAEAPAEAVAEAPAEFSLADLAEPEPLEEPAALEEPAPLEEPAAVPAPLAPQSTLEEPAIDLAAATLPLEAVPPPPGFGEGPTVEMAPVTAPPPLELEPVQYQPPIEAVAPAAADLVPFDDQLQWGAGERVSGAVRREDVEAVRHEEAVAPAIEFLGPEPEPAGVEGVIGVEEPASAPPAAAPAGAADAHAAGGLPLIMPEDVTPPDELARPSAKVLQMVSPEGQPEPPAVAPGEPMLTETMGDLYLKQGFKTEAADVYRRLLALRPDDAALRAKLSQLETPSVLSAAALGAESVGVWLRRVARASLATAAPLAVPPPPAEGPTPMEAAFSAPEPEPAADAAPEPPVRGEPARPASDAFSLDQIFGAEAGSAPAPPPASAPPAQPKPSSSFDEFFGAAPEAESARPRPAETPGPPEDDLSAFNAWLHGLKR